ncbi:ATP-binding cassette domain-containing protein [Jiulongibacter sp. NS-SX5]|uniref:ATP-binding cassette domain-containing protein n=1 Tax=Jiulongibacter sp. NS-SX5 TaxID=3463854 RepID=UPI004058103D
MSCLHIDSVQKSFGHKVILSDIFLQCHKGEIVGLLGRNGCGKSTLLKIIFGSLHTDNRFVKIDTEVHTGIGSQKGQLVYLPQHSFLPQTSRIKDLAQILLGKEGLERFRELTDGIFNLESPVRQLSTGERRIAEILILSLSPAKYALLDEPFNGLAPLQKELIGRILKEECSHKGFIITDHDYRNILDISQRLVFLKDGRLSSITADELQDYGYLP